MNLRTNEKRTKSPGGSMEKILSTFNWHFNKEN
jgi:hypothetical protein